MEGKIDSETNQFRPIGFVVLCWGAFLCHYLMQFVLVAGFFFAAANFTAPILPFLCILLIVVNSFALVCWHASFTFRRFSYSPLGWRNRVVTSDRRAFGAGIRSCARVGKFILSSPCCRWFVSSDGVLLEVFSILRFFIAAEKLRLISASRHWPGLWEIHHCDAEVTSPILCEKAVAICIAAKMMNSDSIGEIRA